MGFGIIVDTKFKYTVHCTHRRWIGKPDPSGFGKFTFSTNNLDEWHASCEKTGVRIDKVVENTGKPVEVTSTGLNAQGAFAVAGR